MSRLDLVVGPNGSGKSTFVQGILGPWFSELLFVNADVISRERWPDDPEGHSYEAARIAEETRTALIETGRQFVAETVCSHPSKIELVRQAQGAGYFVALHVLVVPEDLAVARVAERVGRGGHRVPEDKIRSRYQRLWPLVVAAAALAQSAAFWDNSTIDGPVLAADLADGQLLGPPRWPPWTPALLAAAWPVWDQR